MTDENDTSAVRTDLGSPIELSSRVDVFPGAPLPEYNTAGGQAFVARSRGENRSDMIAIVCNSNFPPRSNFVNQMRSADATGLLKLRESGAVYWPASDSYHYVFAYERPLSPRYWRTLDEIHAPMGEDAINRTFITPLSASLMELHRIGVTHGSVRPNNIFWRDGATTEPQLGECLSAPAGIGQPVLFETLERAMSTQAGRGPGVYVDDTYALGVTIAMVIFGQNPMQGMDDNAIIQARLDFGSFNAIIGTRRMASSHIELMRGLLTDDPRQRWNASDIQEWLSGRRLTPKSTEAGKRANRSFEFAGKEYWQVRSLASALAANVPEAVKIIDNKSLDRWLLRSLNDQQRAQSMAKAIEELKENGKTAHYEDQLVTRACISIDPTSPIRYRGVTVMPDGIAGLLAEAIATGASTQIISEIISNQFVSVWVNAQRDLKVDLVPMAQQYERIRSVIDRSDFGSGIERAVYELNPTMPCASPMLRKHYVFSVKALLPALERIASNPNRPTEPIDRHIAAFIVVHERRGEQLLEQMSLPGASQKRGLVLLTLYADMQYRLGPEQLPGLAKWLLPLLGPSVKRFFNHLLQEKINKQMADATDKGDLNLMQRIIDDPKRISHDEEEFLRARILYNNVTKEIYDITNNVNDRIYMERTVGRPVAATLASAISIILISVTVVRPFLGFLW
ncbi:MAG: serine/threonine protein kinase [Alphaproteobacteria bacterium]|nr:serine/threonine protein kinase [Alphaproteobacteria bacterium]